MNGNQRRHPLRFYVMNGNQRGHPLRFYAMNGNQRGHPLHLYAMNGKGNFLLAWAGQFAGIENQTMHRFEQYLKILQLYHENSRFPPSFKF
jgi:hypothetical protein